MYNVSRGTPSRIINRTRRDINHLNQKLETFDQIRELTRKSSNSVDSEEGDHHHHHHQQAQDHHHQEATMTSPRPVFQTVNNKGCRSTNGKGPSPETISPQHEELIKFFNESWGRVVKEVEMSRQSGHDSRGGGIAYYQEKHVHPALQDFKPFDLDAWWGKRLYQKLTQS
ncbi:MAPK regulated corepressor interacting protein 2-like [Macrobrachium rosenbergii]|uniref:MAPK regulated corepressor interacting protein 2-like n=1 Tax=Macrobrachium rosenbergii TaxID=79674 RepID=UPI0034D4A198